MEPLDYSIFPDKPVVYASFGGRFAAFIIDILALLIPNLIFRFLPGGTIISIVANYLYFALQESGPNMATLGKMALEIKVTDLAGNRITFWQATGRYFGRTLSTIILFIGYFMMLWNDKRQTLHDMMAGTLVVKDPHIPQ